MIRLKQNFLHVKIYSAREELGRAAADETAKAIHAALFDRDSIAMIFAAAPSQEDMLSAFVQIPDIPWERIDAFHMDEYIGLSADDPRCFSNFLESRLFSRVPFRSVYRIDAAAADPQEECSRYSELLKTAEPSIVCMGIGENGHIAFNDPPVADFNDTALVKIVELDRLCRQQQVNDGCFPRFDDVPTHAITLTVPALMAPERRICVVPGVSKHKAVTNTVNGPVSTACPASILRTKPGTVLFLDA